MMNKTTQPERCVGLGLMRRVNATYQEIADMRQIADRKS